MDKKGILLRILLLSDGIAGHYRQSEGIVAALGRHYHLNVQHLEVNTPWFVPRNILNRMSRNLSAPLFLRLMGIDSSVFSPLDLIVSAGAATLGINAALAQVLHVPNIFSGSSRGFAPHRIALTLLPYPSAAQKPGHLYTLKPSSVDPDALPFFSGTQNGLQGQHFGLLIGGTTPHISFESADWKKLAAWVEHMAHNQNIHWHIVTSRRTPRQAYEALKPVISAGEHITFTDFRVQGAGSIADAFAYPVLFVTGDSLSMVSEAVAAQRRTIVLMPHNITPFRDAEALDALARENVLALIRLANLSNANITSILAQLTPRTTNHLDELAFKIRARLNLPASSDKVCRQQ
jgi:mitochondrial fission protein ELM1